MSARSGSDYHRMTWKRFSEGSLNSRRGYGGSFNSFSRVWKRELIAVAMTVRVFTPLGQRVVGIGAGLTLLFNGNKKTPAKA
jgi:hypothetical protein